MKDGTVEFTPIAHALGKNGSSASTVLSSYGKIPNVSGIVKLARAIDHCQRCSGDGAYDILGIKEDGSFYDLSKIIYSLDEQNKYFVF